MMRKDTELWSLLLADGLCVLGLGCGDIGDARVPLPIHGGSSQSADELVPVDEGGAAAQPRAVVDLALAPAPGAACPLAFEALLPDASAPSTVVRGAGPRAISGQRTSIACRVSRRADRADLFDIDLHLLHPELPSLDVAGELATAIGSRDGFDAASDESPSNGTLEFQLSMPDGTRLDGTCAARSVEVLDGAVWFRTLDCRGNTSAAGGGTCAVELAAIFENCQQ